MECGFVCECINYYVNFGLFSMDKKGSTFLAVVTPSTIYKLIRLIEERSNMVIFIVFNDNLATKQCG